MSSKHRGCIRRGHRVFYGLRWIGGSHGRPEEESFAASRAGCSYAAPRTSTSPKTLRCQVGPTLKYRNKVSNDVHVRQRINLCLLPRILLNLTQTSQSILPVNIHRTRPTNSLPTRSPERQCRVDLVLDFDEGVEDHGAAFGQVYLVLLEPWLLGRSLGVLSKDERKRFEVKTNIKLGEGITHR